MTNPIGGAILLAAGYSRRFGGDKRIARFNQSQGLAATTVMRYAEVFQHLRVMVRADDDALRDSLTPYLRGDQLCAVAAHAAEGMGSTLADGIRQVASWHYAFVGLADMPFVTFTTLRRLQQTMARTVEPAILQPQFAEEPGHPVGFHRAFFPELSALKGDQGARTVVQHNRKSRLLVEVLDPGVLRDIDRPADL